VTQIQPLPAIAYAAKSTEDRRGSIPTQLEDCRNMAGREGWELVAEYSDEAASAWSGDRGAGLAKAMEHAERLAREQESAILCVQHSDRIARGDARKARHLVEVVTWAIKARVTIRSVQDDLFADERVALLMGALMGQRNTEDSRRKSLSIKDGFKRRAERGFYTGGLPYGYRRERGIVDGREIQGLLVVVESEAEIVRRIYAEFVAGRSMTQIARGLNADQVPTASGRALWRQATVSGILRRELYGGGEHHDAIVDAETWQRARDLIAARAPREQRGRPPIGHHLFKGGLLRCGRCGESLSPRSKRTRRAQYYICEGRRAHGNEYCTQPSIRREVIDEAVFAYFQDVGLDVEATRAQLAESRDHKLAEVRALRQQAEREVTRLRSESSRVTSDYRSGDLNASRYEPLIGDIESELTAAEAEAERLRGQERQVREWGELTDVEAEALRRLAQIRAAIAGDVQDADGIEAVRAALTRQFERFVIHDSVPARAHVELINADFWIEPVMRAKAVEGYTEDVRPILRRVPLDQARNNDNVPTGALYGHPSSRRTLTRKR
jgi:DNA invertase Pin-like site-specific DNA recombinase